MGASVWFLAGVPTRYCEMAEFDLTSQLGQYLDKHLVFPLLEFISVQKIYDEEEMLQGKLDLLKSTNMVVFAMDVHKTLYKDQEVPKYLTEKRREVVDELKRQQEQTEKIITIFNDDEVIKMVQSSRDGRVLFESLSKTYGFQPEDVDTLYKYAKFQYECGNYSGAAEYLYFARVLLPPNNKNYLSCIWGKLASEILMQDWETALDDLNRLKEIIDTGSFSPLQSQPQYLNAIQTQCPHILRYLTTAAITNKKRRNVLKDLVKIIQQESYTYRDPIT